MNWYYGIGILFSVGVYVEALAVEKRQNAEVITEPITPNVAPGINFTMGILSASPEPKIASVPYPAITSIAKEPLPSISGSITTDLVPQNITTGFHTIGSMPRIIFTAGPIITNVPKEILPPVSVSASYDEECRKLFGNASFSSFHLEDELESSCNVYCSVNGENMSIPLPMSDMTSCGENMVCSMGVCRDLAESDEIANCERSYPTMQNMTAFVSVIPCMINCHPIGSNLLLPQHSRDGSPCQYEIPFVSLINFQNGICKNGICMPQWQ